MPTPDRARAPELVNLTATAQAVVINTATGERTPYATASLAAAAADDGGAIEICTDYQTFLVDKNLTVLAGIYRCTDLNPSGGVAIGFQATSAIKVNWHGGRIDGRLACCKKAGGHQVRFTGLDMSASTAFVQLLALGATGTGMDLWTFDNCRLNKLVLVQRDDSVQQQAVCLTGGTAVGTALTNDDLVSGIANPETILTMNDAVFLVPAGKQAFNVLKNSGGTGPVKLQGSAHSNVALPSYQTIGTTNGWITTSAVNPLAYVPGSTWYPAGGTVSPTAPTITSFTPGSALVGDTITLTGTYFTGATNVYVNGTTALFTVVSATSITLTVPAGATTGTLSVTVGGLTAVSGSTLTVTTAPSGSTSEPTGSLSVLDFTPTQVGIPKNGSGHYYRKATLPDGESTLLGSKYLPASSSGRVLLEYVDAGSIGAVIGLHTSRNRVQFTDMPYAIYVSDATTLSIRSGATSLTSRTITAGHKYALTRIMEVRDGGGTLIDSGLVRVDEYDGTTWTPLYTFAARNTADLYATSHLTSAAAVLQHPQSQGLTALAVATASGHFETTRYVSDTTTGGIGEVDLTGIDLSAFTVWFRLNPDLVGSNTGYGDYQIPLGLGVLGTGDELGGVIFYPDSSCLSRVFMAGGSYASSDSLPVVAGSHQLFIVSADSTNLRFYAGAATSSVRGTGLALRQPGSQKLTLGGTYHGTADADQSVNEAAGGVYTVLGIANRVFTPTEITQLQTANGLDSTISGTQRYFALDSIKTTTTAVTDAIDPTKAIALNSGKR